MIWMIVERIMKNGNDPVLEFGLQDGFSVFQTVCPSGDRDVMLWNKPCTNIAHSNKSDHHLSQSEQQSKQNHTIYYFFVFLYAAHVQLFTTIVHKIVLICPFHYHGLNFSAIIPDEDWGAIGSSITRLSICSILNKTSE